MAFPTPSPARMLTVLALIAAGLLGTALIGQYGFGLHPCHLCMYQRYPYMAVIVLGLIGFFVKRPDLRLALLVVATLLFIADASIASYHAGVEAGVFKGPDGCTSSSSGGETLEQLRAEIMNAPLVNCDQAMVHILGLSLAAWNAVAATLVSLASLTFLYKSRKAA